MQERMSEKEEGEFGVFEGLIPIELETAEEEALQRIPGIGVKRAAAIVVMRDKNGGITMERLVTVSSLGQDVWARLYQEGVINVKLAREELEIPGGIWLRLTTVRRDRRVKG